MCKEYHFFKAKLKNILNPYAFAWVFLSGGLDSCLLLREIHSILGDRVQAIIFSSVLQTKSSLADARVWAEDHGVKHVIIDYQPLIEEGISYNSLQRCYLCKRRMFSMARKIAWKQGKKTLMLDGSHLGDDPALRPGMKANREFGIISPWRELGFGKAQIRDMARDLGLFICNRPSDSCLATRFPWGYKLTIEDLDRLEAAEEALRAQGFICFRLRPADSPPSLLLSEQDQKRALCLGVEKVWDIIRDKTGWDIKDWRLGHKNI